MHTNWCVLIEISMEIGMLNFWLELLVTAQTEENYFRRNSPFFYLSSQNGNFISFGFLVLLENNYQLWKNFVRLEPFWNLQKIWHFVIISLQLPQLLALHLNDKFMPQIFSFWDNCVINLWSSSVMFHNRDRPVIFRLHKKIR